MHNHTLKYALIRTLKHKNVHIFTHIHTYTHSHTHTLSLTNTLCLPLTLSHTHTLSLIHTRTHSKTDIHTHTHTHVLVKYVCVWVSGMHFHHQPIFYHLTAFWLPLTKLVEIKSEIFNAYFICHPISNIYKFRVRMMLKFSFKLLFRNQGQTKIKAALTGGSI